MTQPTSFTALRNILASLYPDVESMRRLLADAGIDVARVSFTSSALNNWHAILSEAANLHRLDALIDVALAEYGENPQLQAAVTAYRQAAQASNIEQRSATLDPSPALTTPTPATDIFLSYSRADAATMQRLRADLQAAGFSVWIDDLDLEPGTPSWQRAVEAAIYATRGMVVILSPAAKNSEWVGRELSYAAHLGRRIFPVLVSGDGISAIPLSLINHQRVDLRTGWNGVGERLIPALRRHLRSANDQHQTVPLPDHPPTHPPTGLRWQRGVGVAVLLLFVGGIVDFVLQNRSTLGIGSTWTNPADGTVYVYVPAGTFLMGSTDAQVEDAFKDCLQFNKDCKREWFTNETPQHAVTLDAFWIMQTEVTNAEYTKCVAAGDCAKPHNDSWDKPEKAQYPVTDVDWQQASAYAKWAGGQLPTEAQWEKAGRGPDGLIYSWGNTWDSSKLNFCDKNCTYEWKDASADDRYAQTAPVNSFPEGASPYKILNMVGNVWEWTSTAWGSCGIKAGFGYPYNPDDGREKVDASACWVVRGGSWGDQRGYMRAPERGYGAPDFRNETVGFRLVRFVSPGS